eukprot:9485393-Pyramimonas_sp.AAC.1
MSPPHKFLHASFPNLGRAPRKDRRPMGVALVRKLKFNTSGRNPMALKRISSCARGDAAPECSRDETGVTTFCPQHSQSKSE